MGKDVVKRVVKEVGQEDRREGLIFKKFRRRFRREESIFHKCKCHVTSSPSTFARIAINLSCLFDTWCFSAGFLRGSFSETELVLSWNA